MRCDNCGNEFKNSLTCPLCGHRQTKISRCSVCGTTIHHGQAHCTNCGTPTKYYHREDISKNYHSKFIPTDYAKHSEKTHVYQEQEMYDYKSSNADIKKRLDEARQRIANLNIPAGPKLNTDNEQLKRIAIVIIAVAVIGLSLFDIFFSSDDKGTEEITTSEMAISHDNDFLTKSGNYLHGAYGYLDGDDLYLNTGEGIIQTDRYFEDQQIVAEDIYADYLYVEDEMLYYNNFDGFSKYNLANSEAEVLFSANNVLPLGNQQFIYIDTNQTGLQLYHEGVSQTLTSLTVSSFAYDEQNELVYYSTGDKVYTVDLIGKELASYDLYLYGDMYVDGGIIYFADSEGVKSYDTKTKDEEILVEDEDIYQFTIVDDEIVYLDFDDSLYVYDTNEEASVFIYDNIDGYCLVGDKIIFSSDQDEQSYLENWFVGEFNGQIASLDLAV